MRHRNQNKMSFKLIYTVLALALSSIRRSCIHGLLSSPSFHRHQRHPDDTDGALLSRGCNNIIHQPWLPSTTSSLSSSAQISSDWDEATISQLKSQLKQLNLPISGVKSELIQRLEQYHYRQKATAANTNDLHIITPKKKSVVSKLPPPKDEIEIQVIEKEVQETVRLLEGLKLGGKNASSSSKSAMAMESLSSSPSSATSSTRQLSRQQKQERELMQSLKQSLRQSQLRKSSSTMPTSASPTSSDSSVVVSSSSEQLAHNEKLQYYIEQLRMRPANDLKVELTSLGLPDRGRKPDLVNRLAEYYVSNGDMEGGSKDDFDDIDNDNGEGDDDDHNTVFEAPTVVQPSVSSTLDRPVSFAGIPRLSAAAATALHRAFGSNNNEGNLASSPKPTPIQASAIPYLFYPPHPSALLHAPTGSGKTISYLLPITETLWREVEGGIGDSGGDANDMSNGMAIVLLPTRELAAQVAGVASVLAPPGMVRLVPHPMDLMRCWKEEVDRGEEYEYLQSVAKESGTNDGKDDTTNNASGRRYKPRILIGSAKAIGTSLFGDSKMPGTPTRKPDGKQLLSSVRWLVMDECDRLLNIEKSRSEKKSRRHEKPAALLAAAIARLTLGRVQVIAASATIGRPLRRELSRVLGLHSSECPETIRGEDDAAEWEQKMANNDDDEKHVGRAVKIPDTVKNYVLPVDGSTTGSLLTAAAFASKAILRPVNESTTSSRKVLVVLTRNCGIKVHNALGVLRHFGIQPEPQSLLDALEADGTDRLVEAHRRVSRVEGVGGGATTQRSNESNGREGDSGVEEGYLLITHENNVRGLHLAGLDAVVVVGRPGSPDEYTHIAGRTGRAGRRGSVLNIVSYEQAAALASWTKMLGVDFSPVDESGIASILDE